MKKIQYLEARLSSCQAGDRSWFWFSPDSAELPLLLERFADPQGMARLLRRAGSLPLPPGARVCTGISVVSEDGEMQFGSPLFEDGMLSHLADWVHSHHGNHPGLAHLSGARFVRIDGGGKIQARFSDPALWKGLPRPARAGTLASAAALLSELSVGADAWIWLSEGTQVPIVLVEPLEGDPKAERFGPQVLAGRRRSGRTDAGVRGTVRRLLNGALLVSTGDDLSKIGPRLSDWLAALGEVRLARIQDGEVSAGRRIGGAAVGADLSAQCAALEALDAGQTRVFWFTDAARNGAPLLLLEESMGALKGVAAEADSGAPAVRGQVRRAKWGLEFRARKAHPDFLVRLSRWVRDHHRQWPALLALVDARMTVRDRAGEIVSRARNDEAWADLRPNRS